MDLSVPTIAILLDRNKEKPVIDLRAGATDPGHRGLTYHQTRESPEGASTEVSTLSGLSSVLRQAGDLIPIGNWRPKSSAV